MASEDHDFDEINYFNFKGKKVQWNRQASGAVGELNLEGLEQVFNTFSSQIGSHKNAEELRQLFKEAYLNHDNLAEATRYIANTLFKDYGLVVIDANDQDMKRLFIPFVEEELTKQTAFKTVSETNKQLSKVSSNYKIQVNPRARL